ncbi:hypothetical protein [Acidicapsa dinghuensis]|uniref:hypothetical protein n=1 Tax=Acidicapsa dinghuensis TaxID=2218256 RepID=UPI0021DF59AE|nr:hypothetical protein [Acidicapsa dinghuensis]
MSVLTVESVIDEKVIENCEINDACEAGLSWLRKKPRSFADLRDHRMDWYRWLAEHCTISDVLDQLATDTVAYVRCGVAENAATPPATLRQLATDTEADVRCGVAKNAATPPATLRQLATDTEADVRWGVAKNAATPPATLQQLATDTVADVRWGVAENAATPPATLRQLATDTVADVTRAARVSLRRVAAGVTCG